MAKVKFTLTVAPTAIVVWFKWEITPEDGRVMLYRTLTDPVPQTLHGPSGEGSSDLTEPQTLYYEFLPGTTNFKFLTKGYKDDFSRFEVQS